MDDVFRALADPSRRLLLDELFREDGQTLGALQPRLPMTRFGVIVRSDWKQGSTYRGEAGGDTVGPGTPILEGEILEIDPPRRLVQSFRALWNDAAKAEGTSRVTYEITPVEDSCRLTVVHDQ